MESVENEPMSVDMFSEELERLFRSNGRVYVRKIEPIKGASQVKEKSKIETRLPDGTLESVQEANSGDWVITGSKGEEFVFTNKKFHDLYEDRGAQQYVPRKRKIIAMPNPFGRSIRIQAPWGTPEIPAFQDGGERCMLVASLDDDGSMTKDRYIIGDEEMLLNNYTIEDSDQS
ncbi:MAG: hypothetical protein KGI49_01720 [Patescibacteria group bacterium]|nr:hypothetical protein [Patescibacteria group bacterium]